MGGHAVVKPSTPSRLEADQILASCASKNRYSDIYAAVSMGIDQKRLSGYQMYTYHCRFCRGWHLTKSKYGRNGNPVVKCDLKSF